MTLSYPGVAKGKHSPVAPPDAACKGVAGTHSRDGRSSAAKMASVKIADTYAFLVGTWDLTRRLEDRHGGMDGSFQGRATLEGRVPDGAGPRRQGRYFETGNMAFGSRHAGPATRTLDVVQLASGAVQLVFVDGRPFIDVDLADGRCRRRHACRDDLYEIEYFVRSSHEIEEHWRVRGPHTDYDAYATLVRAHSRTSRGDVSLPIGADQRDISGLADTRLLLGDGGCTFIGDSHQHGDQGVVGQKR
jgi:hypothetical protein